MGKTLFLNDENVDYLLSCALEGTRNRFDLLVSAILGEDATMKGLMEIKHLAGVTKDAMESLKVHVVVAYAAEGYLEQAKRKYASHEDIKLVSGWLDQARDLYKESLHLYEEMWQVDNDALALFIIEKVRSMNRQAATISNLQLDLLGLKMMAPYQQLLEEEIIYSMNVLDDKIGSMAKTKAGINKLDGDLADIENLTFTLRMFKKEYDTIGSAIEAGNRHVRSILTDPDKHKCQMCHIREAPQPLTHILAEVLRDKADRTFGLSMEMRNHVADCLEFRSAMWHVYDIIDAIERRRAMEQRKAEENLLAYGYGLDFMRYIDEAKSRGEHIDPMKCDSFRKMSRLADKSRNGLDTKPRMHSIEDKFLDPMLITSRGIGLPLSIFEGLDDGRSDDGECHCNDCRSPKEGMDDLIDKAFKSHSIHHIDDDQLRQFIKTERFNEIIREAFSKSG